MYIRNTIFNDELYLNCLDLYNFLNSKPDDASYEDAYKDVVLNLKQYIFRDDNNEI